MMTQSFVKKLTAPFGLLLCASIPLSAVTQSSDYQDIVVEGAPISSVFAGQLDPDYILDAEAIAARATADLHSLLQTVPGVMAFGQGGRAGLSKISLRGGETNHTVILVDGVKMNDPTNSRGGGFDLGSLDVSSIERIEVYHGSQSTFFGGDALSGVISIWTKGHDNYPASLYAAKDGSAARLGGAVSTQLSPNSSVRLRGGVQDKDNSYFGDAFQHKNLNGLFEISPDDGGMLLRLQADYAAGEGAYFPEDSGGDRLATIRDSETRDYKTYKLAADMHIAQTNVWKTMMRGSYYRREDSMVSPGIAYTNYGGTPASNNQSVYEQFSGAVNNRAQLSRGRLSVGAAATSEKGEIEGYLDLGFPFPFAYELDRDSYVIFGEWSQQVADHLTVNFSGQLEFGAGANHFSKHLSLDYSGPIGDVTLAYGEGFKRPSFFALGNPLVGNKDLVSERSKSYTLTVAKRLLTDSKLTLSAFYNQFDDLIDFDGIAFTFVNRSRLDTYGLEMGLDFPLSDKLMVQSTLSLLDYTLQGGGMLRNRPKVSGHLSLQYHLSDAFSLHSSLSRRGSIKDSSLVTGLVRLPALWDMKVSARYRVDEAAIIDAGLENALQNKNEYILGFTREPRRIFVRFSYRY